MLRFSRCSVVVVLLLASCLVGKSRIDSAYDPMVEGLWTLIDLQIPEDGLARHFYKVNATFCHIDWNMHQENPSKLSFFDDLKAASCPHKITVDLGDMVSRAKAYDQQHPDKIRVLPPTGIIFHQSRCGSTLAANMLATLERTRIYSETGSTVKALRACTPNVECHPGTHQRLVHDVYYLLGRSTRGENIDHVFYKTNSGGMFIEHFTAAFPQTPWVYMYREPTEIIRSHWKIPEDQIASNTDIPCARNYDNPFQPTSTQYVLNMRNVTSDQLTRTEYCAVHLDAISHSVVSEHERTGKGLFINYQQMPHVVWERMLPQEFRVPVTVEMRQKMQQVSRVYSKGKGDAQIAAQIWTEDTTLKRSSVTPEVHNAVQRFCPDTYQKLEHVRAQQ
eukprot:scaffold17426_cov170-Amphora_coffeaeformis.AAC.8